MSRYEWMDKAENKTISIGWDRPMRTFFAMIHDENKPDEDKRCIFWIGGRFDEFKTLDPMLKIFPYVIPGELRLHLEADEREDEESVKNLSLPEHIKKIC